MTAAQLSPLVNISGGSIQKKAKRANDNTITFTNGDTYLFTKVKGVGGRGEVYDFTLVEEIAKKRKTVSKEMSFVHLVELATFNVLATKHTTEEKLLLITFMRKYNYTMKIIIESLLMDAGVVRDNKKVAALNRKFLRWQKEFNEGGVSALADKRGKTRDDFMKIDLMVKTGV